MKQGQRIEALHKEALAGNGVLAKTRSTAVTLAMARSSGEIKRVGYLTKMATRARLRGKKGGVI